MGMTFNAVEVNSLMNSGYSTQIILTSGGTTYIAFAPPNCSIAHTDARWTCCKIVDNGEPCHGYKMTDDDFVFCLKTL